MARPSYGQTGGEGSLTDEGGWTRSYRRKWRNPVFRNFRDAAVWSFLTDNAAWQDDTDIRFEGHRVILRAGQIATSERFLAEGFCCDRQVIRRILDALELDNMITREKTHGATIITICNYNTYQGSEETEEPSVPAEKTQVEPTSNPNIKEGKESKKESQNPPIYPPTNFEFAVKPTQDDPHQSFEIWWDEFPHKVAKGQARKAFFGALKKTTLAELIDGLRRYIRTKPADINYCYPATFLNGERWLDEPATGPPVANISDALAATRLKMQAVDNARCQTSTEPRPQPKLVTSSTGF